MVPESEEAVPPVVWMREESEEAGEVMAAARSFELGAGELMPERPLHTENGSSTMRSMK